MFEINEIVRVRSEFRSTFVGTLRNAKRFEMGDDVFLGYGNEVFRAKVVGVELLPEDNPHYIYKVTVPEEIIRRKCGDGDDYYSKNIFTDIRVTCDLLFNNLEEARESMVAAIERTRDIDLDRVERYFRQFDAESSSDGNEQKGCKYIKRDGDGCSRNELCTYPDCPTDNL